MASFISCGLAFCMCVYVCEVLAVTWQTGQGGAARGLLIIMGGAVCVCL